MQSQPARTVFDPICSVIAFPVRGRLTARQESIVKYRGVDFDVEEKPLSWWRWKIYSKIEAGPKVVCSMIFQTREAAIAACIVEINSGLDRGQRGGGSE
jgi:hypothetical protein